MPPPEQFKPNWTAIGVIGGFIINISGWFVVHYLTKRREAQKDRKAREDVAAADIKKRDAASAEWRRGFREIVVHLRTEMIRGESPGDWFPTFDASIPILNRVASSMPASMDSKARAEIHSIVQTLTSMSAGQGEQAVYGAQKVVNMLVRLEELTNDT